MSLISPHHLHLITAFFLLFHHRCTLSPAASATPHSDPADVAPLYLNPTPPATIPAFPEQSDAAGCPLDLSDDLFPAVKSACPAPRGGHNKLHRTRCCPVLAAWLYAAYSATALSRVGANSSSVSPPYDMPVLPDDSETCVDGVAAAMKEKGLKQLSHPNATCDLVYCYCGIRLHPLSCRGEFFVTKNGKVGRSRNVKRLERDCLGHGGAGTVAGGGISGISGCSKCLKSLHLINKNASDESKYSGEEEDRRRRRKMQHMDCELMGLTWLLSKNTTAYFHTVSNVLRAMMMMMNPHDDDDASSCSLTTDGLPLAVASSQISGGTTTIRPPPPNDIIITLILFIAVSIFLWCHLLVL